MEKDLLDWANDYVFLLGGVLIVAYFVYLFKTSKHTEGRQERFLALAEETVLLQRETNALLREIREGRGTASDT
jgi:hypothetical protein